MRLIDCLIEHLQSWADMLPQQRSLDRLISMGFGLLCGAGKRTITRAICFHGNTQKDWSADYKIFSRSPWEPQDLFAPILAECLELWQPKRIVVSVDDTRVWRTGLHVPQTQWHRDPMGPAFQTNLRWGHRFLQASLVWAAARTFKDMAAEKLIMPTKWNGENQGVEEGKMIGGNRREPGESLMGKTNSPTASKAVGEDRRRKGQQDQFSTWSFIRKLEPSMIIISA